MGYSLYESKVESLPAGGIKKNDLLSFRNLGKVSLTLAIGKCL